MTDTVRETHQYTPLDVSAGEVRLLSLRLEPHLRMSEGALDCRLAHFPILNTPIYKALSYTWGEPSAPKTIIYVNGHSVQITQNVDDALRSIWQLHPIVWIWIDALCINQDDILERNTQVPRMTDVYQCAENVIVWLGLGSSETATVMKFLRDNCYAVRCRDRALLTDDTRAQIWWPLVQQLLSRPWWRRLWILQEVAVAQSVDIMCGSDSISWDILGTQFVADDHKTVPLQGDMYSDLQRAIEVRNIRFLHQRLRSQGQQAMDWKDLLVRSRTAEASLTVDKLYGLLGLAQQQLPGLRVDYGAAFQDVLKQFTRLLIQRDQRLDFICMSGRVTPLAGLPSWVPNLGAGFRTKPFNRMRMMSRFGVLFDANGTASEDGTLRGDSNVHFGFSEEGNTLSVDGVIVDEITGVANALSDLNETWLNMRSRYIERALSLFPEALSNPDAQYSLGRSQSEALQITLAADQGSDKKRITTSRLLVDANGPTQLPSDIESMPGTPQGLIDQLATSSNPVTISLANRSRSFVASSKRYMGLAPEHTQAGDIICVIFGCDVPVILRRERAHYIFVGESYVHGLMYGFAIDDRNRGDLRRETFLLH